MNEKEPSIIKDRTLGDEWEDWDGSINETSINELPKTFVKLAFFEILVLNVIACLAYYLIYPRFFDWSSNLAHILTIFFILSLVIVDLWFLFFSLTIKFKKNLLIIFGRLNYFFSNYLFDKVSNHSKIFKISKDRISNSFIKINNIFSEFNAKTENEKLLILLPRCLTKENFSKIRDIAEQYNVKTVTVAGGSLARKKIKEICPKSVIGIACERDLVSGIKEVSGKLTTFGIPNMRPNGPCKNTEIDINHLKNTIELCVKKRS